MTDDTLLPFSFPAIADLRIVMDWLKVDRVIVGNHPVLADNAVAWDANGRATHDGLMAALAREIAGDPLMTHDQRAQAARLDQPVAELRRMVIAAGLDPATVSRDDVRTLMQRKAASGKALGQSTTPRGAAWSALAEDVNAFSAAIQRVVSTGPRRGVSIRVGDTPLIFNKLGVSRKELRIQETKVEAILKHDHPEVSAEQLGRAAALLADPVMVMRSGTEPNALVAILDDVDAKGNFLLSAIHLQSGAVEFHKLASMYGKDRQPMPATYAGAQRWIDTAFQRGDVVYLNNEKAPKLSARARVSIPALQKARGFNATMLSERDLVKERRRTPDFYQPDGAGTPRGRFDQVANDITLFRAADLSTFAHESGHAWLFQMVHDLEDARLTETARNRIIADLRIVMDWLKVDRVIVGDHPVLADNAVAWDANGRATHDGLIAALAREIAGDPLLTHDQRAQAARLDQPVAELRRMVIAAGLDPATVSRDDVRTLMQRKTASDKALGQEEQNTISALKKIADGAEEATVQNLRPDLIPYGGTSDVTFIWGDLRKGIAHIGEKRGADVVLKVARTVSVGSLIGVNA